MATNTHCRSTLIAPLFLRFSLGIIFLWAGLGKIYATMPVTPANAAALTAAGVTIPTPAGPASPAPSAETPPSAPSDSSPAAAPTGAAATPQGSAPADSTSPAPAIRRLWGLALRVHSAANPPPDDKGAIPAAIWPRSLGSPPWPRLMAIGVVVAEIGGGVLVLLGLFTRLGAASLAMVMFGAVWLDQVGPQIQAGNTILGLIPAYDRFDVLAWMPLFLQLSLLASASALLFLGAGALSLDRLLFAHRGGGDDDEL